MWDLHLAAPFGRNAARKFIVFVAALLVTVFAYILLFAPQAFAADATWNKGAITYQTEVYNGPTTAKTGDGRDLPDGTILYSNLAGSKMKLIYFPAGSDPAAQPKGTYVDYDRFGTSLSNKSPTKDVTFDVTPAQQSQANQAVNDQASSCKVDGIGWIICPVTTFLAKAMDWVFDIISGFLVVRPLDTTSTNNPMFHVWQIMRNFANVAFVIVFLIIIYSQITSIGITNYSIKKLLPRLIIAAILVNISYWTCTIAIDLSNILGSSLQGMFIGMRNGILGSAGNNWQLVSWESVTGAILSGTALTIGAVVGFNAIATTLAGASVLGGIYLILPLLLGAVTTVLVVLLILAARQAIITLLVIIAPLAFVAYLLPNTEKWFEKWRELFMTMLLMFPAFSLVFGGSQLAGLLIIQNATDINVVLLGMAVQVAPLAITPLLIRLSGRLLSRIAGIINNPNKGILDRTKNWSKDRLSERREHEMAKNRRMEQNGKLGRRHVVRRNALRLDNQKRLREGMKSINESDSSALFSGTTAGQRLHSAEHLSHQLKERMENVANAHIQHEISVRGSELQVSNLSLEAAKLTLEGNTNAANAATDEFKAGGYNTGGDVRLDKLQTAIVASMDNVAVQAMRGQSAKNMQQKRQADILAVEAGKPGYAYSQTLLNTAAGIDPAGKVRAQANAAVQQSKIESEAMENTVKLLNATALKKGETLKMHTANIVNTTLSGTGTYDATVIEAALDAQAQDGNAWLLEEARGSTRVDQKILDKVYARNAQTMKTKGGFTWQATPDLNVDILGPAQFEVQRSLAHIGDLANTSASYMSGLKFGWLDNVAQRISTDITRAQAAGKTGELQKVYDNVYEALTNADIRATIGDRLTQVQDIEAALRGQGFTKSPTTK